MLFSVKFVPSKREKYLRCEIRLRRVKNYIINEKLNTVSRLG